MILLASIVLYVVLLFGVSFLTNDKSANADFFLGGRRSPWWAVAIGMVGASVSGVSFVSVPGWVTSTHFSYMQMVVGFIVGYILIAYVLLPVYYRSNQTSIYAILEERLGMYGRRTAAVCFLFNKLFSSALKHYVVVLVLHQTVFAQLGVPFWVVALSTLVVVWLYSFKSGIRTIVWTDFLQTILLVVTLILLIHSAIKQLNVSVGESLSLIADSELSNMFVFDWGSRQNFWKQFVSGAFVVLVMTGMDQDLMQKNLSCKTLKEAQKNVLSYGVLFVPLNLLLLSLGVLLNMCFANQGDAPAGDSLLPQFAMQVGGGAMACFAVGMMASAFSSVDSALTSITTSLLSDFTSKEPTRKRRIIVHIVVTLLLFLLVVVLGNIRNEHAIDTLYTIISYLYGPMLGMFAFALFMRRIVHLEKLVPLVAVLAVMLSYGIDRFLFTIGYKMGYELLLLNGLFMFVGLLLVSKIKAATNK